MGNAWSKRQHIEWKQAEACGNARRAELDRDFPAIPRPCGTPGAVYTVTVDGNDLGCVVHLPFSIENAIPASAKEEMKAALHDALLPIIERFYRKVWKDTIAGKMLGDDPEPMPERWEWLFAKWLRRSFERGEWPEVEGRALWGKHAMPDAYRTPDFRYWPEK